MPVRCDAQNFYVWFKTIVANQTGGLSLPQFCWGVLYHFRLYVLCSGFLKEELPRCFNFSFAKAGQWPRKCIDGFTSTSSVQFWQFVLSKIFCFIVWVPSTVFSLNSIIVVRWTLLRANEFNIRYEEFHGHVLVADQRLLNSREFHRSRASAQEDKRTLAGSHLDRICIRVSILLATGKLLDHAHTSFESTVYTWTHWIYTSLKKAEQYMWCYLGCGPFWSKDTTVLWQSKASVDWELPIEDSPSNMRLELDPFGKKSSLRLLFSDSSLPTQSLVVGGICFFRYFLSTVKGLMLMNHAII